MTRARDSSRREAVMSVTNPEYYTNTDIEPIEVIEEWGLSFCLGSVIKYIKRAGDKPGNPAVNDLKKARWYIDREISRLDKKTVILVEEVPEALEKKEKKPGKLEQRRRAIIDLWNAGKSNTEIAEELKVGGSTIYNYLKRFRLIYGDDVVNARNIPYELPEVTE